MPTRSKAGRPLRSDELILPDLLWDKGVRTALISDVPLLREAGLGYGRGFDDVIWVRGGGYDPLIPAADPRTRKVRLRDEPGLRLPADDDAEPGALEKALGAVPQEPGRAADGPRGEHGSCQDGADGH